MALSHLYLIHPSFERSPHLAEWIEQANELIKLEPDWVQCSICTIACDREGRLNVPSTVGKIRANKGPVIIIHKMQAAIRERVTEILESSVPVAAINVASPTTIYNAYLAAAQSVSDGHPRASLRQIIAYLILSKLARHNFWGGESLFKSFIWDYDLPSGGFPKPPCADGDIMQVADMMQSCGLLVRKRSEGHWKYALGDKAAVERIIDTRQFADWPQMRNYFSRTQHQHPVSLMDFSG